MARKTPYEASSLGRSIAVPLAFFGLLTVVVGGVRMVSGEDQSFVVLLGGVFILAGAITSFVVGERAGSRDTAGEVSRRRGPRVPRR